MSPKKEPTRTLPCLIGRKSQRSGMSAAVCRIVAARSSGPPAAGVVLRAERGVALDLLVGRLRVPEEVAGRVDADHHRAVDALRVAPGVDHRRARPGALAEEVDAVVAERLARGLEVVDLLRQRRSRRGRRRRRSASSRRRGRRRRTARKDFSPRRSVECASGRFDLGAVEADGAVDAAVADEDDVVVVGEPARLGEVHVREPGPALEAEDRLARVLRAGTDAGDRAGRSAATAGRPGSRGRRACRSRRRSCPFSVS